MLRCDAFIMAAKGCLCGRIAHWNNVPIFGSCPNESSLSLPRERFLHTAVILNSDLVVFGGRHVHKTEVNHPGYHNGDSICMCVIWTYDIDAECWRKHLTPALHAVPRPRTTACAVLLEGAVYMHGGHTGGTDNGYTSSSELWKLMRSKNGTFRWGKIKFPSRSCVPSVRYEHTGWQYNNMMWIFGGRACNPSGYLHDHGEFVAGVTNQLMCYSPDNQTWVDVGSTGAVPPPRGGHATASMGSHVWLYGGFTPNHADSNVYELDLRTLTWTKFNFPPPNSGSQKHYLGHTLTRLTEYTLILHGGYRTLKENDTYSLDLNTMCWSHCPIRRPHGKMQCGHTATSSPRRQHPHIRWPLL